MVLEECFICPICGGGFLRHGGSLVCPRRHCFDVSREGYVNFVSAPQKRVLGSVYGAGLFAARAEAFAAGFFDALAAPLLRAVADLNTSQLVLDAGCGEGSALLMLERSIAALPCRKEPPGLCGADISRDAVRMAARRQKRALWCVADLCRLPLTGGSVDALLNVLSPANYAEFNRILKPGGRIVKVLPGEAHLAQVRGALGIAENRHDDDRELLFALNFTIEDRVHLTGDFPCRGMTDVFYNMTPLAAGRSPGSPLDVVTYDFIVLTGRRE